MKIAITIAIMSVAASKYPDIERLAPYVPESIGGIAQG
jgi:hypothetical protein